MNPPPASSRPDLSEQRALITSAAAALRAGELIVIPTETVYGLAANASLPQTLTRLQTLAGKAPNTPFTWHAPSAHAATQALGITRPLHSRLFKRLAPGPVRFIVELDPATLPQALDRIGIEPGIIDQGGEVSIRIPDHPIAAAILEQVRAPIVAERASAAGLGDGRSLPGDARDQADKLGIGPVIDDGPTRLGKPSTALRLHMDGSYHVVSEGVYDSRYINRKVERSILFICTGNTCRSPMAEAIARDLIEKGASPIPTRVGSAGVMAASGAPMTPEAKSALKELGVNPGQHRSRELTPSLILDAEVVFGLTHAHVQALQDMAPSAADKIKLLDPDGSDVQDPIGGPLEEYRVTAQRLRELIDRRLNELADLPPR